MFKGCKQSNPRTCIFASIAGVLEDVRQGNKWDERTLVRRYNEFIPPSFGSVIRILGPDLEQEGIRFKQVTKSTYGTIDEYVRFIRQCLKDGLRPILSREIFMDGQLRGWHMITIVEEEGAGFLIHDVADGSKRFITG